MIEILEKVSDQVKEVEHMCRESVPVLEGNIILLLLVRQKLPPLVN